MARIVGRYDAPTQPIRVDELFGNDLARLITFKDLHGGITVSKFDAPGSLIEALRNASTDYILEEGSKWQSYRGPHGGHGWRNTTTGEVVYQEEMPQSHGGSQEDPQGQQPPGAPPEQGEKPPADGEQQAQGGADKEPQSPEEWSQFFQAVQQDPNYQKVKSKLAEFKADSPNGDIRSWSKAKHSTKDGQYTPERQKLHQEIVSKMLNPKAAVPKGQRPAAVLLLGPPGAGKSTTGQPVAKLLAPEFTTINSDDVKSALPEYQGWNAALVHEESADVAEGPLTEQALDQNHNTIFDLAQSTR